MEVTEPIKEQNFAKVDKSADATNKTLYTALCPITGTCEATQRLTNGSHQPERKQQV